jgi:transposase-like protein
MPSEPTIPACLSCGSARHVHHFGRLDREDDPAHAWFECVDCQRTWTDLELSTRLLAIDDERSTSTGG